MPCDMHSFTLQREEENLQGLGGSQSQEVLGRSQSQAGLGRSQSHPDHAPA